MTHGSTTLTDTGFSWWLSSMLHNFGETAVSEIDNKTFERFMSSELEYYLANEEGLKVIANQYVGLPYEELY